MSLLHRVPGMLTEGLIATQLVWRGVHSLAAAPRVCPWQVAVRQQRAAAAVSAPPGFDSPADTGETPRLNNESAVAPPPGFEKRSPLGFSRTRPANGVKVPSPSAAKQPAEAVLFRHACVRCQLAVDCSLLIQQSYGSAAC